MAFYQSLRFGYGAGFLRDGTDGDDVQEGGTMNLSPAEKIILLALTTVILALLVVF